MSGEAHASHNELHRYREDRIEIWYVDVLASASALAAAECATPRLSAEELQWPLVGLEGVRRTTRTALRLLLERFLPADDIHRFRRSPLAYERAGRPVLGCGLPALPFSLSHSGEHAVIAITNASPVGIDIEAPRKLKMTQQRREAVVAAAMALPSNAQRRALSPTDETDILRAWTRLEAVGKARGSGVAKVLSEHGVFARSARPTELPTGPALAVHDLREANGTDGNGGLPMGLVGAVAIAPGAPLLPTVTVFPTDLAALAALTEEANNRIRSKHS